MVVWELVPVVVGCEMFVRGMRGVIGRHPHCPTDTTTSRIENLKTPQLLLFTPYDTYPPPRLIRKTNYLIDNKEWNEINQVNAYAQGSGAGSLSQEAESPSGYHYH